MRRSSIEVSETFAGDADERALHGELSGLEVDVAPVNADDLALSQPCPKGENVEGLERVASGRVEERPRLLGRECVGVSLRALYGVHGIEWAEGDDAILHRATERGRERVPDHRDSRRREAGSRKLPEERPDVFRCDLRERDRAEAGDHVTAHPRGVADPRRVPKLARPGCRGPRIAQFEPARQVVREVLPAGANVQAVVALPQRGLELLRCGASRLRVDRPAAVPAGLVVPEVDDTLPSAVAALEETAFTVCASSHVPCLPFASMCSALSSLAFRRSPSRDVRSSRW